jgi:murein L,D-transpeptidase YcbB/YkuD
MIAKTVFRFVLTAGLAGLPAVVMADEDAMRGDGSALSSTEAAKQDANDPIDPLARSSEKEQSATASEEKPLPPLRQEEAGRNGGGGASQAAAAKPSAIMALDAAPNAAAPDPLTPPDPSGPAPKAPGAPDKPVEAAQVPAPDPVVTQILALAGKAGGRSDAREDASALNAFYTEMKGSPVWTSPEGFTPKAVKVIHEIKNAGEWGLDASAFQIPANPGAGAKPEAVAEAELKLSLAVLKYARHARGGRLDPPSLSPIIDRRPHIYDPKSVLEAISTNDAPDAYLRGLHPKHEQFKRLRQALISLNKGGGVGPAQQIPAGPDFRPGDDNPQIALIRKRLGVPADGPRETSYDTNLLQAVNRYQREHGLDATGIIDRKLRASLNEGTGGSVDEKRLRLIVNMERWRWMPDNLGEFYVWDSITEQYTRVFDHGKIALMEKIVVGKPTTPTPTFSANMQFVIFNPEWGVPDGIKVNEIAPRLKSAGGGGGFFFFGGGGSSEILQRLGGLRVSMNGRPVDPDSVDWSHVDIRRYQFIQGAGGKNVLGVVKFRFPNKHDVYMHDTPDRHLFGSAPRAFSHGCMRTQNPVHLAEVLLAHDKGLSPAQIHDMVASGQTNEIKLTSEIPVHVVYFTADADERGEVRYYPDLYGLDSRVAAGLRGEPVHFAHDPVISTEEDGLSTEPGARPRPRPRRPYAERRPWNPFEDSN